MEKELPVRKIIRLQGYDYSSAGYYYITMCVKYKHELFGEIVGTTALGRPRIELTALGKCVDETIQVANKDNVKIDKYVIMPNHIHMIIILTQTTDDVSNKITDDVSNKITDDVSNKITDGFSNKTTDDRGRSSLQQVVRNIKSYVTKWAKFPMWQSRFYDEIIQTESDYQRIWHYIDQNPMRWVEDEFYNGGKDFDKRVFKRLQRVKIHRHSDYMKNSVLRN